MTELFDIKADEKLPHHYIIAVGVYDQIKNEKCGQFYLKYKPIHFVHQDILNIRDAVMLSKDKVFKTSTKEAINLYECDGIISTIGSIKFACLANKLSLHHFSSSEEIDEEWFLFLVENAHQIESLKTLLKESIMR